MSRSLKARIQLDLHGNVARKSRLFGRSITTMGERGERAMTRLQHRAHMAGNSIGLLAGRAATLAGTFLGIQAIGREINLDHELEQLGVSADVSTEKMKELYAEIVKTAEAPDLRLDPKQILAAIRRITEATGDLEMGRTMQREIGMAIRATGAQGDEIGRLVASISEKFDIKTPEGMKQALDLLAKQGKEGAIELSNLASLGPKVFSVYASFGKNGLAGLAEAGALMQIFKRAVGSAEEAATIFENVFNTFGSAEKIAKAEKGMKGLGLSIRDASGELLGPVEMMKALIEATNGDDVKLGAIFDDEAMRGVRQLVAIYKETGGFKDLNDLTSIKADGKTIEQDSGRMAATAAAQLESATASLSAVAGDVLAPVIQELADALKQFDKELLTNLTKAAAALAATYAGTKIVKGGVGMVSDMRAALGPRRVGANISAAGPLGAIAGGGPVPVFVTNPGFGGASASRGGAAANAAAANAAQTSANANATMRRAVVNEAAGNARGRAVGAGGTGILMGIGAISAVGRQMDGVMARRDELMSGGMAQNDAFGAALDEEIAANSAAFDGFLANILPSVFGKSDPEPRYAPVNLAKRAALAPFEARADGETGGGIVDRLIAPAQASSLPQSTPAGGVDVIDRLDTLIDETRDMRRGQEDTQRILRSTSRKSGPSHSRPGNTFSMGVSP